MSQTVEENLRTYETFKLKASECLQIFDKLSTEERCGAWGIWTYTTQLIKDLLPEELRSSDKQVGEEADCLPTHPKRPVGRPPKRKRGRPSIVINEDLSGKKELKDPMPEEIESDALHQDIKENYSVVASEDKIKEQEEKSGVQINQLPNIIRRSGRQIKPSKIYPGLAKMTFKRDSVADQDVPLPIVGITPTKVINLGKSPQSNEPQSTATALPNTNTLTWVVGKKGDVTVMATEDKTKSAGQDKEVIAADVTEIVEGDGNVLSMMERQVSDQVSDHDYGDVSSIVAFAMKDSNIITAAEPDQPTEGDYSENEDDFDDTEYMEVENGMPILPDHEIKWEDGIESDPHIVKVSRVKKPQGMKLEPGDREDRVRCTECGKILANRSNLMVHLRVHSGEKPYTCSLCGKKFSTRPNMLRHEKTHTGEKPYKCDECSKCFTENKSLKVHMRKHTGEKPYRCIYCGRCFSQPGTLQSHMHVHTGWKGHLCQFCGKSFRQKSQLRTHQLRHDNIRNFICPTCSKAFISKGDLERHRTRHTGERPYLCQLCPKTFTRLQYLKEHMNIHTGNKPYKCRVCGDTFPDVSSCSRHTKRHESQTSATQDKVHLEMKSESGEEMYIMVLTDETNVINTVKKIQSATGEALMVHHTQETVTVDTPGGQGKKQVELNIPSNIVLDENGAAQIAEGDDAAAEVTNSDIESQEIEYMVPVATEEYISDEATQHAQVLHDESVSEDSRIVEISVQENYADSSSGEVGQAQQIILQTSDGTPLDLENHQSLLQAILEASRQQGHQGIVISQDQDVEQVEVPVETIIQTVTTEDTIQANACTTEIPKIDILAAAAQQEHLYSAPPIGCKKT